MGTWIEIFMFRVASVLDAGRSLRGNVDRNAISFRCCFSRCGRSLRGNVDRNIMSYTKDDAFTRRSLRGNVDRNFLGIDGKVRSRHHVVPYVGTWIEMMILHHQIFVMFGRSLRGNVDRNVVLKAQLRYDYSRSLRGNVDRNLFRAGFFQSLDGRSLRGNVDRNAFPPQMRYRVAMSFPTWERG